MWKAFFKSLFLIGCWILVNLTLPLIEPYVSAFQNGMPLQNRIKIERFIAKILESVDFDQFFGKTLRGYLGHLKPFNFRMNGIFGWPWVGSIQFCGQNQNPRSDHDKYHSKSRIEIPESVSLARYLFHQCSMFHVQIHISKLVKLAVSGSSTIWVYYQDEPIQTLLLTAVKRRVWVLVFCIILP